MRILGSPLNNSYKKKTYYKRVNVKIENILQYFSIELTLLQLSSKHNKDIVSVLGVTITLWYLWNQWRHSINSRFFSSPSTNVILSELFYVNWIWFGILIPSRISAQVLKSMYMRLERCNFMFQFSFIIMKLNIISIRYSHTYVAICTINILFVFSFCFSFILYYFALLLSLFKRNW